MKVLKNMRENCSHRLNLLAIYKNHTVYLKKLQTTKEGIIYIESDEETANAYKIGHHIIDGSFELNYRIFKKAEVKRKRQGKQIYGVTFKNEISPDRQKRKMIRLYTAIDDNYYMTSILRYYEIVYIIHTLRKHNESKEFWNWICCEDKSIQINHITGDYTNSGNIALLEICTMSENLTHGSILNYFRKQTADSVGALFMATAKECCLAKEKIKELQGKEKVAIADVYSLLLQQNKVVTSL